VKRCEASMKDCPIEASKHDRMPKFEKKFVWGLSRKKCDIVDTKTISKLMRIETAEVRLNICENILYECS